jgi:hypothetical protein
METGGLGKSSTQLNDERSAYYYYYYYYYFH